MKNIRAFFDAVSDRMNPVLCYELRQAANNRILLSLLLFYIALLIVVPFFGNNQPWNWTINHSETTALLLVRITFDFSILIVLVFPVARLVDDLVKQDLLFLTDLSPRKILLGKLQSGMAHTALFYITGLPFIIWWSLCQTQHDIFMPLATLLLSYLVLVQINAVCLGFMAGTRTAVQAVWLGVCAFLYLCYGFYTSTGLARVISGFAEDFFTMPRGFAGIGFDFLDIMPIFLVFHPFVYSWSEFPVIALAIAMGFIPATLAILIGNAFLASPSENRMLPIRVGFSAFGLFLLVCGAFLAYTGYPPVPLCQWGRLCGAAIAVFLSLGVSERETWGLRLRRTIPVSFFKRICVFPLYTGVPNVFAWSLLGLLLLGGFAFLARGNTEAVYYLCSVISGTMLVFCIWLLTFFLRANVFKDRIPKERAWLVPGIILMSLSVAGLFVFLLSSTIVPGGSRSVTYALAANPLFFTVLDPSLEMIAGIGAEKNDIVTIIRLQFIVALSLFTLSVALISPWLYLNWKQFRRDTSVIDHEFGDENGDNEKMIGEIEC